MSEDRSLKVHDHHQRGRERFDYFVVGAAGALCAFMAQKLDMQRLGFTPGTLELAALLTMIGSVVAGFKRIEAGNATTALNAQYLHQLEMAAGIRTALSKSKGQIITDVGEIFDPPQALKRAAAHDKEAKESYLLMVKKHDVAVVWYRLRNRLLLAGVLMLIAARVWTPYYSAAA